MLGFLGQDFEELMMQKPSYFSWNKVGDVFIIRRLCWAFLCFKKLPDMLLKLSVLEVQIYSIYDGWRMMSFENIDIVVDREKMQDLLFGITTTWSSNLLLNSYACGNSS